MLDDPEVYPDDEVLSAHLGGTKKLWDAFLVGLARDFPDAGSEWHFYKDGGSWLCKIVKKKKTVCWVSVQDRFFRITVYFKVKDEGDVMAFDIRQDLKDAYIGGKSFGKIKPMTVDIADLDALAEAQKLVGYKVALK